VRVRPVTIAAGTGGVGLLGLVVCALADPQRTAFAYLAAWVFAWSAGLGVLLLAMIHHVTGSTWFVAVRRLAEESSLSLLPATAGFVPIALCLPLLYPWLRPGALDPAMSASVAAKAAYLNLPFFFVRASLYFGVWLGAALLLARWSRAQSDAARAAPLARRQKQLSTALLPASALALTFASVDWIMSLEPTWASSIFGVYVFAGAAVAGVALLVVVAFLAQRAGALVEVPTVSHYHALGKLLHTFVIFWAYVAFMQFFVIWIANVPRETTWYVERLRGGWQVPAALLVVGHFVIPFLLLLSRPLKRDPARLAAVALWLLAMHFVDVYWMIVPARGATGFAPHLADAAALLAVCGFGVAFVLHRMERTVLVARGDPRFARALGFTTR